MPAFIAKLFLFKKHFDDEEIFEKKIAQTYFER